MQKMGRLRNVRPSTNVQIFLQNALEMCLPVTITLSISLLNRMLFPRKESQRWKENARVFVFELPNRSPYQDHTGGTEPVELLPLAMNGLLFYSEEDSRSLPNSDKFLPDYMATHIIRQFCL
jgi:hypothetical protein